MKKIISVILIAFTLLSVLPAADGTTEHSVIPAAGDTFGYLIKPYQPLTARALGMGSAGVALPGRSDTFYISISTQQRLLPTDSRFPFHPFR